MTACTILPPPAEATGPARQASSRDIRITAVLATLMAFGSISTDLYLPAMPMMSREFGARPGELEYTISGYLIGFSLGQLVWGAVSDRVGRRVPVAIGIALFVIGSAGCALSGSLSTAVQRFARATADILRMRRDGRSEMPHQRVAYDKAQAGLDAVRPDAARDLRAVFAREPELVEETANGQTAAAIRAMALEAEVRASPELRADRFVQDWQRLARAYRTHRDNGDETGIKAVERQMGALGKGLERDAQAESLVRKRLPELSMSTGDAGSISHDVQNWLDRSRSRGLGR